jgi:hypothetical protein
MYIRLILVLIVSYAFSVVLPDSEINNAIKKGDYKTLAKYFNQTIELTIPGNEGTYSKTQAEMIIKDFFNKYPPKNFIVKNTGKAKSDMTYIIGDLITDKATFRTYYLLIEKSGSYYIQQLKFER